LHSFKIWLLLGGIVVLVLSGIVLLPEAATSTQSFSFQPGQLYRIEFSIIGSGQVSGNYSEASGSPLNLYVFTENQYSQYSNTGSSIDDLYRTTGASGSFVAYLPGTGNYYVILSHTTASLQSVQTGHLTAQVQGLSPVTLLIGTTCFIIGGVFIIVAIARNKIEPRQRTWYAIAIAFFVPMLLSFGLPPFNSTNTINTVLGYLGLLFIPILIWYVLGKRVAPIKRLLLAILRFNRGTDCEYFFDQPRGPGTIEKTFGLAFAVFGISAFIVQRTVPFSPDNLGQELGYFLGYSILALSILCIVLIPLWIYEDSGLRCYNPSNGTVFVPGAFVAESVKDFGGFLGFALFAIDITKDPIAFTRIILALLIFLAPACLLCVIVYRYQIEPRLIRGMQQTGARSNIHKHKIRLLEELEKPFERSFTAGSTSQIQRCQGYTPRFCEKCGQALYPSSRFCANCGSLVQS